LILNRGAPAVFVSESLRRHFAPIAGLDDSITRVIYNGIDATQFRPGREHQLHNQLARPDEILIGAVGNVRAPKAYDDLLQAAGLLKKRGVRFRLLIAGDSRGFCTTIWYHARAAGLTESIEFLGRADVASCAHSTHVLSHQRSAFATIRKLWPLV
jgi:glycosyltransferase involved in cell wall biosynthesis